MNVLGDVVEEEYHLRESGAVMLLPVHDGLDILLGNLGGGRIGVGLRVLLLARSVLGYLGFIAASAVVALLLEQDVTLSDSWLLLRGRLQQALSAGGVGFQHLLLGWGRLAVLLLALDLGHRPFLLGCEAARVGSCRRPEW